MLPDTSLYYGSEVRYDPTSTVSKSKHTQDSASNTSFSFLRLTKEAIDATIVISSCVTYCVLLCFFMSWEMAMIAAISMALITLLAVFVDF